MARRIPVLCAVLVMGLLAVWLLQVQGTERTPAPAEAAARPDAQEATFEDVATIAAVPATQREPVTAVEPGQGRKATRRRKTAQPVPDETGATLVVLTIDKGSGAPLADVRVSVMPSPPVSFSSTYVDGSKGTLSTAPSTAADGRAEFELPAGIDLRLTARGVDGIAGDAESEISPLKPGERRELTLEIPTGDDVHYFGLVLAGHDNSPIAGARIELFRGRSWFTQQNDEEMRQHSEEIHLAEEVTDAHGQFDLWLPSWKEPDIRIRAPGFGDVLLQVGQDHDTPEKAKVVLLHSAAALRARVLDAGGAPLAEGAVRLWTESYHLGEADHGHFRPSISEQEWIQDADAAGLCALEGLPPDVPFHVEILRDGTVAKNDLPSLSLREGEVREIEWRVGSGCCLEGSVVDQSGAVVQGQAIWLQRADHDAPKIFRKYHSGEVVLETRTDSDGRFVFADVSSGTWWLGPAAERDDGDEPDPRALAPMAQVVEVAEGALRQEVELRVHRGLYVRGRVLDPEGLPVGEVFVMGYTEAGSWGLSAQSGPDGAFALGPLEPGHYWLNAHGWTDADSEPIAANAGDEGVVLQLKAGVSLKGTLRDRATGKGCAGEITLSLSDSSDPRWWGSNAREDGTFRVDGLPPGTYCLAARASGLRAGLLRGVSVREGNETEDLVVNLVPGAVLRVKYAGEQGYLRYRIASDGVTVAGDGVLAGGNSQTVVPAGHLVVECQWMRDGSAEEPDFETREIELAVGEDEELVFGDDG